MNGCCFQQLLSGIARHLLQPPDSFPMIRQPLEKLYTGPFLSIAEEIKTAAFKAAVKGEGFCRSDIPLPALASAAKKRIRHRSIQQSRSAFPVSACAALRAGFCLPSISGVVGAV